MVDVELSLFIFQVRRINISNRTVAIPFKEGYIGILRHNLIYDTKHEVLYFRIAQVKYQLITEIISFPVRVMDSPFRMCFEQVTFGIHHLWFNPDTEFDTGFFRFLY